jgi:lipoprotein NlpI
MGENNKAVDDLTIVIDKEPNNVQALISRGAAYARGRAGSWAIQDFDRALKIEPNLPVAHFNKGMVFFLYSNFTEAAETFDKAIELDPQYAEAYTRRGMSKFESKWHSLEDGCSDFKKAEDLGDELAAAYVKKYCK